MVQTQSRNLTITRGDHSTKTFTVTNDGSSYDMSSSSALTLTVKSSATGSVLHTITGSGTDGTCSFAFTPTETATVGRYVYDVQETTNGSEIRTLVQGILLITQDVNN